MLANAAPGAPRWTHVTSEISADNVLEWAARLGPLSLCWARPDQAEVVCGVGIAAVAQADQGAGLLGGLTAPPVGSDPLPLGPWFGAMAFDPRGMWDDLPAAHFILPQWLVWRRRGRTHLSALSVDTNTSGSELHRQLHVRLQEAAAQPSPPYTPARLPSIVRLVEDRPAWDLLLDGALQRLREGGLSKVVLARAITALLSGPTDGAQLLTSLMRHHPTCQTFFMALPDGSFFAGATPETLLRMRGNVVETDCLAGSSAPAAGNALLHSAKDLEEHRYVVDFIAQRLLPLTGSLQLPASPGLLKLANITHLHTPVRAVLRETTTLQDVLSALHPTPAVCGTPQQDALDFIHQHEGLQRGYYSGPVGVVGAGNAHFGVALRCARVRGKAARVFVGAGIVAESHAASEWEETRRKSRAFLGALAGGADA